MNFKNKNIPQVDGLSTALSIIVKIPLFRLKLDLHMEIIYNALLEYGTIDCSLCGWFYSMKIRANNACIHHVLYVYSYFENKFLSA